MESLVWRREFVGFSDITNNKLKKLSLLVCNEASLRTLIGHCPNLEEMNLLEHIGSYSEFMRGSVSAEVLDQVIASVPMVQRIGLAINVKSVHTADVERKLVYFWNLPLVYLRIRFDRDILPVHGDGFLRKVATSFPNLQELRLSWLKTTNQGVASLADLQELQVLKLALSEDGEPYDQGFCQLAHCKELRKLNVCWSEMTGGTLVSLLRSCPQLERVEVWDIAEVESPEEAVVILSSLVGIPKRDIVIRFHDPSDDDLESIWQGEPAKAVINKLEEDDGVKITIEIVEDDDDGFMYEDDY